MAPVAAPRSYDLTHDRDTKGLMSAPDSSAIRRVLVVDDEPNMRDTLSILFRREGYDVTTAPGYQAAVNLIEAAAEPFPVVLTDLRMPDGDGFGVLEAAKARSDATEVIVMTAYHEHAYDAMRRGAYDFVSKPFPSLREVFERVQKAHEKASIVAENKRLRACVAGSGNRPWVARSAAMRRLLDVVDKVAPTRTTVLITGESGTGKERIARLLHEKSDRAAKPFLVVNCGALPEALMESELFGHEKGAFTGAATKHMGLLREANGGTLLLDEVGELPMPLQVKLLRVLQEKKVRPVGGTSESDVDVRILAATNADIEAAVNEHRFRQDLYYRLNVIRLQVPPLREREDDLALLVEAFVRKYAAEQGKDVRGMSREAFRLLSQHSFPGNVRELENIIERAVALADGPTIRVDELPDSLGGTGSVRGAMSLDLPQDGCQLDEVLQGVERRLILQALERAGSVRKGAARLLGITFRSLRYRLDKLSIDVGDDGTDLGDDDEPLSAKPVDGRELSPAARAR